MQAFEIEITNLRTGEKHTASHIGHYLSCVSCVRQLMRDLNMINGMAKIIWGPNSFTGYYGDMTARNLAAI